VVTDNIDALLAASDIMATDISGVALEFLSLMKPVIYIECPEFFDKTLSAYYRHCGPTTADYIRNDPKSNAGRHVGYVVKRVEDLPSAVKFVLENPDFKRAEREEFAKRLRYNPGRASEAAAQVILQLLRLNGV
jgi:CDP-glycerol glycerophosphotransferase (TagB/SpsB family)